MDKLIVDSAGYVSRKSTKHGVGRNWFLVKAHSFNKGRLDIVCISFPKHLIGRRIRLKVEVIKDD